MLSLAFAAPPLQRARVKGRARVVPPEVERRATHIPLLKIRGKAREQLSWTLSLTPSTLSKSCETVFFATFLKTSGCSGERRVNAVELRPPRNTQGSILCVCRILNSPDCGKFPKLLLAKPIHPPAALHLDFLSSLSGTTRRDTGWGGMRGAHLAIGIFARESCWTQQGSCWNQYCPGWWAFPAPFGMALQAHKVPTIQIWMNFRINGICR